MDIIELYGVVKEDAIPVYLTKNVKKCQIWNNYYGSGNNNRWDQTINVSHTYPSWFNRKDILIRVIK